MTIILSFRDRETEEFFRSGTPPRAGWQRALNAARRKLDMLDAAKRLADLRSPPSNQLEALRADRLGQHSLRINKQWRLCFVWTELGAADVEVVDYH